MYSSTCYLLKICLNPYVKRSYIFRKNPKSIGYDGPEYNILKALSEKLNFTFELKSFPPSLEGTKNDIMREVSKITSYLNDIWSVRIKSFISNIKKK